MKIQKWLFPSKANKYHPHLVRPIGLGIVVALLLGINLTQNLVQAHSFQVLGVATNVSSSDVFTLQNQQRVSNGLASLSYNSQLTAAAQAKARDMLAKDYWSHYAPDGTSPWDFITAAGYSYSTAGENLAKNFDTSTDVVQGWMNSAPHRANVLNSSFSDVGIAVMNGTLLGEQTTLVVTEYGAPSIAAATPAPAPTQPAASTPTPKQDASVAQTPALSQPTQLDAQPTPQAPQETSPVPDAQPKEPPDVALSPATTAPAQQKRPFAERSISARQSRTWSQNASLFIVLTLFLVNVLKHTAVWRVKKKGLRHIWLRAHPAAQYALLLVAIVANMASGVGVIR